MDKFKKIMVGFFMLASVNFVSINCFAMKSKNKPNKIVDIKSDVKQLSGNIEKNKIININEENEEIKNKQKKIVNEKSGENQLSSNIEKNINMQNILKAKRQRDDEKDIIIDADEENGKIKNKPNKIVKIKSDVKQLSGNIEKDIIIDANEENEKIKNKPKKIFEVKRNDEKNGVVERSEDKFKLVNIKDESSNMKEIVETIKLNMLKYLAKDIFIEKIDEKIIEEILEKYNVDDYSKFYIRLTKEKCVCPYSFKIKRASCEELDEKVKKEIVDEIKKYVDSLKEDVYGKELIDKLKTMKKSYKKYHKLIKFLIDSTEKYFYMDNEQNIATTIKYIFDELKNETDYSKYLEILKGNDALNRVAFFNDYDIEDSVKTKINKKLDDEKIIKLNILKILSEDLIIANSKKNDIKEILNNCGIKNEFKDFEITTMLSGKNIENRCDITIKRGRGKLDEKIKDEAVKRLKNYFNYIKDDILGDELIKNLKGLKIKTIKYSELKNKIENSNKKYFMKNDTVNFRKFFSEFKEEKNYSEYLDSLKKNDLVNWVCFDKTEKCENKKTIDINDMKENMLKFLAKDLFKDYFMNRCLNNFLKDCNIKGFKNFDIRMDIIRKKILYSLILTIPGSLKFKNKLKRDIGEYLKKCFNDKKKEIFNDVIGNLKNDNIKKEEYNNMINLLKKIWKKYFIIEDGKDVEESIKDIFNEFKAEKNYYKYLENLNKNHIVYKIDFHNYKAGKEKDVKESVEESDEKEILEENVEEGVEESDEKEIVEESDEEEGVEEENMEEENKYKHLRAMNEYKNTDPLNYLNDVNEFVEIMEGLKEYNIISNKNDSKEKALDENGGYLEENILKEKTNENFNFNPNEIIYNKYKKDFNLNDKNNDNDNIL